MTERFGEAYFLSGEATGESNYTDYCWRPELTIPMVRRFIQHLGILAGDTVLDYGCARGYVVRAFRILSIDAWGYDTSEWAIANCDQTVKAFVSTEMWRNRFDWIVMKDVAEHLPEPKLYATLETLLNKTKQGLFIIVPLTEVRGGPFVCERDERDPTHAIRWTLDDWLLCLQQLAFKTKASWMVQGGYKMPGVKQLAEHHLTACGFFTLRRL